MLDKGLRKYQGKGALSSECSLRSLHRNSLKELLGSRVIRKYVVFQSVGTEVSLSGLLYCEDTSLVSAVSETPTPGFPSQKFRGSIKVTSTPTFVNKEIRGCHYGNDT